jgi:hypothetical protein
VSELRLYGDNHCELVRLKNNNYFFAILNSPSLVRISP